MAAIHVPWPFLTDSLDVAMAASLWSDQRWDRPVRVNFSSSGNPWGSNVHIMAGTEYLAEFLSTFRFQGEVIARLRLLDCLAHVPDEFWRFLAEVRFTGQVGTLKTGDRLYTHAPYATLEAPSGEYALFRSGMSTILSFSISHATETLPISDAVQEHDVRVLDGGSQQSIGYGWSLWVAAAKWAAAQGRAPSTWPRLPDPESSAEHLIRPWTVTPDRRCDHLRRAGYDRQIAQQLAEGGFEAFALTELRTHEFLSFTSSSSGVMVSMYTSPATLKAIKTLDYDFGICDTYYQRFYPAVSLDDIPGVYGDRGLESAASKAPFDRYGELRVHDREVPAFLAANIEELEGISETLGGTTILYRGQTRPYFLDRPQSIVRFLYDRDEVREPSLLASAHRNRVDAEGFLGLLHLEFQDLIYADADVAEFAHTASRAIAPMLYTPRGISEPVLPAHDAYWGGGGARAPVREVAALAQHYGIPTSGIDLTASLEVAVWFATHQLQAHEAGEKSYISHTWGGTRPEEWPCLYFFTLDEMESEHFAVVPFISGPALRPRRQQAFLRYGAWGWYANQAAESLRAVAYLRPGFPAPAVDGPVLFPGPEEDPFLAALIARRQHWRRCSDSLMNEIYDHLIHVTEFVD